MSIDTDLGKRPLLQILRSEPLFETNVFTTPLYWVDKYRRTEGQAVETIAYVAKNVAIAPLPNAADLVWATCFSNPSGDR